MLSDSPPDRDVIWSEDGVQGAARYVQQLWRLVGDLAEAGKRAPAAAPEHFGEAAAAVRKGAHRHLLNVEDAIRRLRFNTAIAEMRKLSNALAEALGAIDTPPIASDLAFALREAAEFLTHMAAPMMPHLAEECWARLGHTTPISESRWPAADQALAVDDTVTIPVQVNGKKRGDLVIANGAGKAAIEAAALRLDGVLRSIGAQKVRKVIVVEQRIVNVVV